MKSSTKKTWFATLLIALTLFLVACGSSVLADTVKAVEAAIPTSLNDGDVFSITNPHADKVEITWVSSDTDIIAPDGKVTAAATDSEVVIEVTFKEGSEGSTYSCC